MKIYWINFGGLISILILVHFSVGCNRKPSNFEENFNKRNSEDFYGAKLNIDTLVLKVDSLTVIPPNSQLISGDSVLFFFNKSLNALEFHHLYGINEFERIILDKEGPNGIGSNSNLGIFYFSKDTLVVSSVNNLILINRRGEVYKRMKIDLENLGSFPDLMIQGTKPVWKQNNKLIISVFPHLNTHKKSDLKNWQNFLLVDLDSSEFKSFGKLPLKMQSQIFGINFLNFSHAFNDQNEMIISFAPINNLFRIPLISLEKLEEIDIKVENQKDVPSLENESNSEMQYVLSHYLLNNSFDGIFFNGKQYLRISQNPLSENDYDNKSWAKTKNIMLYDVDFNLLSFWNTNSKSVSYNMIYPTQRGFLMRINSVVENEFRFIHINNDLDEKI
ncbi:DUF4221 domain-containing protein [Aquiflexum sp. LQ15W]|uniref:DUF4221 family protein n=1 Tax=Cognataquiflexum nitidum TaxID=2922272 RepID=UPI001F1447C0|nr:DUF4221 family protein [Cognataquiflexum nitidum]MCH6200397.1 DUF4221 domain-containing protein [Cognataquiflexum nitidum]